VKGKILAIGGLIKRDLLPEELGATGVFLASDGAAAITGQVVYVDCGLPDHGGCEVRTPWKSGGRGGFSPERASAVGLTRRQHAKGVTC